MRQKCLVIAYAVHESGRREVLGLDVGEAETEGFWRDFLRSLTARGLNGVRLCVSDAHEGLRQAIAQGARLPVAALHGALLARHAGPRPEGPAAAGGRRAAPDLRRPEPRRGPSGSWPTWSSGSNGPRRRSRGCWWTPRTSSWRSSRFPRDHWTKLRSNEPAGTGQPRDRAALRRGRHLPQRRRPDPARRRAPARAEPTSGWSAAATSPKSRWPRSPLRRTSSQVFKKTRTRRPASSPRPEQPPTRTTIPTYTTHRYLTSTGHGARPRMVERGPAGDPTPGPHRTRGRARPEVGSPASKGRPARRVPGSALLLGQTLRQGGSRLPLRCLPASRTLGAVPRATPPPKTAGNEARRALRSTGHGARPRMVERGPAGDPTPRTAPNPRTRSTRSRITGFKGPPRSTGPR